jgi:crossover junction endodeoxyribonuclease RuvC
MAEVISIRVLGIDPGLTRMGIAVVERTNGSLRPVAVGVIATPADLPVAKRLVILRGKLQEALAATSPDVVAVERLFFNSNARTAMSVGQAAGVAIETAAEGGLDVYDYTPGQVKRSVVGVGDATKAQVQAMVAAILGLSSPPRPADAADACALAICHHNSSGLARAVGRAMLA